MCLFMAPSGRMRSGSMIFIIAAGWWPFRGCRESGRHGHYPLHVFLSTRRAAGGGGAMYGQMGSDHRAFGTGRIAYWNENRRRCLLGTRYRLYGGGGLRIVMKQVAPSYLARQPVAGVRRPARRGEPLSE
jgi:hypothetical protein